MDADDNVYDLNLKRVSHTTVRDVMNPIVLTTSEFTSGSTHRWVTIPMCPDLLRYDQLGEADNLRGRVVRGFFWLMRIWPT